MPLLMQFYINNCCRFVVVVLFLLLLLFFWGCGLCVYGVCFVCFVLGSFCLFVLFFVFLFVFFFNHFCCMIWIGSPVGRLVGVSQTNFNMYLCTIPSYSNSTKQHLLPRQTYIDSASVWFCLFNWNWAIYSSILKSILEPTTYPQNTKN